MLVAAHAAEHDGHWIGSAVVAAVYAGVVLGIVDLDDGDSRPGLEIIAAVDGAGGAVRVAGPYRYTPRAGRPPTCQRLGRDGAAGHVRDAAPHARGRDADQIAGAAAPARPAAQLGAARRGRLQGNAASRSWRSCRSARAGDDDRAGRGPGSLLRRVQRPCARSGRKNTDERLRLRRRGAELPNGGDLLGVAATSRSSWRRSSASSAPDGRLS